MTVPNDPERGLFESRSPSRGRPTRRGRHWRLKSRVNRSSARSGQSRSEEGSADNGSLPTAPTTMPAGGVSGSH